MQLKKAVTKAKGIAQQRAKRGESDPTMFVVDDYGSYEVATPEDLETFYMSLPEERIVYSTADGYYI